ncbi:thiol peroxidase [Geothrix fuzhouensis]|uniref:thiol peroxidase n=1 Tax=Geothrix fuzhouensis TaxID=2966451 RepID=UPI00214798C8|nr:thiol peroxidase [Geothrix fuzhouensis]
MAKVTLKGNPFNTAGDLPKVGSTAPAFTLVRTDLSEVTGKDLAGQRVVLNIFPSLDTPTCAASVRKFNARANEKPNTTILCVSADLPFAQKRFCGAEGLDNVVPASVFRAPDFGKAYGVTLTDGPMKGLLARAVVVVDGAGKVVHTELVPEIAQEPDYNAALAVL